MQVAIKHQEHPVRHTSIAKKKKSRFARTRRNKGAGGGRGGDAKAKSAARRGVSVGKGQVSEKKREVGGQLVLDKDEGEEGAGADGDGEGEETTGPSSWVCKICTLVNKRDQAFCEVCEAVGPRNGLRPVLLARPSVGRNASSTFAQEGICDCSRLSSVRKVVVVSGLSSRRLHKLHAGHEGWIDTMPDSCGRGSTSDSTPSRSRDHEDQCLTGAAAGFDSYGLDEAGSARTPTVNRVPAHISSCTSSPVTTQRRPTSMGRNALQKRRRGAEGELTRKKMHGKETRSSQAPETSKEGMQGRGERTGAHSSERWDGVNSELKGAKLVTHSSESGDGVNFELKEAKVVKDFPPFEMF
jgi:hypothetical protein